MTYGRPREFDIDRALEAATQQFWSTGYEATSLQDLLQSMSLSKSSLYQTFGNKHELFIRCLGYYQQTMVDELNIKLANSTSACQFLYDFLGDVISEAKDSSSNNDIKKGCFLVNTANELCQRDASIAEAVSIGTTNVAKVFRRAIEQGKKQQEINTTQITDSLVDYLITSISGLRTMIKAGAEQKSLKPVIDLMMTTFSINER
jgi:TetR/AcrR family transcriptional regulator, transcriptional repressor for nem operon